MYDFYFGSKSEIQKDEIKYLISIKRMMPRWVNSLPDFEFISIAKLLDQQGKNAEKEQRKFVTVETGVGASSLAFVFYAIKYNGLSFTWDLNAEKGSLIRQVCTETIGNYFNQPINKFWKLIAFDSLSSYLGLGIIDEQSLKVDMFLHDSEHVWNTVKGELNLIMPTLYNGAIIALDDANQDYLHTNLGYINTFRKKYGLSRIENIKGNKSKPYYQEVENLLNKTWADVELLDDPYKLNSMNDPYFKYYNSEFDIKSSFGTERVDSLEHRFDSWRVSERKEK